MEGQRVSGDRPNLSIVRAVLPAGCVRCGTVGIVSVMTHAARWTALTLLLLCGPVLAEDPAPPDIKHTSPDPMKCKVCRPAYDKAVARVCDQLRRSTFPVKMVCGWLLLADGRHPKDLEHCIDTAIAWKTQGAYRERSHPGNWYPALAGVYLAEVNKHRPKRRIRAAMSGIIAHFAATQEKGGGWYKWHEGALRERLDYPTVDLGYVTSLAMALLHTARAQGIAVPPETMRRGEEWLARCTTDRGIAYGTTRAGRRSGGEKTGGRGSHLVLALGYAGKVDHRVFEVYRRLLPDLLPNLDQGHHVGALHGLAVTLGCHTLGPKVYRKLTDLWLARLMAKQEADGGLYIGDDGDAGGESGLLRGNVGSTAAFALMILLQDHDRLVPKDRERNKRDGTLTVDRSRKLRREQDIAAEKAKADADRKAKDTARREARAAEKAARKALDAEAAVWNERLTARVREALGEGSRIAFKCRVLGKVGVVASVDERGRFGIRTTSGATLSFAPGKLSYGERAEIAVAAVRPEQADDHLLAAFFTLAAGDVAAGKAHLEKCGAGAEALRGLFRKIGRIE
jgi:hypothetical protein